MYLSVSSLSWLTIVSLIASSLSAPVADHGDAEAYIEPSPNAAHILRDIPSPSDGLETRDLGKRMMTGNFQKAFNAFVKVAKEVVPKDASSYKPGLVIIGGNAVQEFEKVTRTIKDIDLYVTGVEKGWLNDVVTLAKKTETKGVLFTKILEGGVINGATIQIGEGKDREVIQLDVIEEARLKNQGKEDETAWMPKTKSLKELAPGHQPFATAAEILIMKAGSCGKRGDVAKAEKDIGDMNTIIKHVKALEAGQKTILNKILKDESVQECLKNMKADVAGIKKLSE